MSSMEVVQNPGRRHRRRGRRSLTAKQLAAGFGGKRSMHHSRPRRRHRNPLLASLANPHRRRHRARRRHRYSVSHVIHRNPGFLGFDFEAAAWIGAGALGSKLVPNLVRKWVYADLPSTGPISYLVRAGGTLVAAYGVKLITKNQRAFHLMLAGGLGMILVDVVNDYVMPMIPGMAGMGNDQRLITRADVDMAGTAGYVDLRGYVDAPNISTMTG